MVVPGLYNFVSTDKYDQYLEACGVGFAKRKIANSISNQLEFIDHGNGKWTQKTHSSFKNFEITFTVGEPFVEETADGRKCDAVVTIEGNKFLHKQTLNGESALVTREFKDNGELVCTFAAKDKVGTRVYKKVQ